MSSVVLAVNNILEKTMEQYLGQFLVNIMHSLQDGNFSNTLVSGFIYLAVFTVLAYLVFRIAVIALKIGTVIGVLALVVSMGMPNMDMANANPNQASNAQSQTPEIQIPDFSQYFSEEKLREAFLGFILGVNHESQQRTKGFQK